MHCHSKTIDRLHNNDIFKHFQFNLWLEDLLLTFNEHSVTSLPKFSLKCGFISLLQKGKQNVASIQINIQKWMAKLQIWIANQIRSALTNLFDNNQWASFYSESSLNGVFSIFVFEQIKTAHTHTHTRPHNAAKGM